MRKRTARPWPSFLLGLLCICAAIAAYLVLGPPSEGATTAAATSVVTAKRGVVQSTVSGSGDVEPTSELDLGFKTSGTVEHIYVRQGEHVVKGQLIAKIDPKSAEVTLEQAKASLRSAEAKLTEEEEDEGESSSASTSGTDDTGDDTTVADIASSGAVDAVDTSTSKKSSDTKSATRKSSDTKSATRESSTDNASTSDKSSESSAASSEEGDSETTLSAAAREANIDSARAAVKSARLEVRSAEQAVKETELYAPESGTIVSLGGEVGETVSGTGTTKDSSATSSSSSTEAGGESAAGGSSSSSSSFAVLSDLDSLQLVVALSAAEIGSVKDGQVATVTIEALEERKVSAHVVEVATLPSSESGVVSYDVTFKLDQTTSGLKPGMSATAEVVVKQAEGVNVPTEALEDDSVTVVKDGKDERRAVVTGLAGETSTIITSGLKAGEEVAITEKTTSTTSSSETKSTTGGSDTFGGAPGFTGGAAAAGGGAGFTGHGGPP